MENYYNLGKDHICVVSLVTVFNVMGSNLQANRKTLFFGLQ